MKFKNCVTNPTEIGIMDSIFSYAMCKNYESSISTGEWLPEFCAGIYW